MVLECSGVNQHASTFWSVTLQPVGADQATMWQMKGDIPSIHIRHRRLISIHRFQRYGGCINLNNFPLVILPYPSWDSDTPCLFFRSGEMAFISPRQQIYGLSRLINSLSPSCEILDRKAILQKGGRNIPNWGERWSRVAELKYATCWPRFQPSFVISGGCYVIVI